MILFPSVDELLKHTDPCYPLVMFTSKRVNELDAGAIPLLEYYDSGKSVGKTLGEILAGKVTINPDRTEDLQD